MEKSKLILDIEQNPNGEGFVLANIPSKTIKDAAYFGLSTNSTRNENSRALKDISEANQNGEIHLVNMKVGEHKIHDPASLNGNDTLKFNGNGADFITDTPRGVFITREPENKVNNISFENLGFKCIYEDEDLDTNKYPGLIFFGSGQLVGLNMKSCYLTAPGCHLNGLKTANETVKIELDPNRKIRFTKNVNIEECLFKGIRRIGVELWGSYFYEREASLFNVNIMNSIFDEIGSREGDTGIGMSIASLGSGLYTDKITLKNIWNVGIETVDINNIQHNRTRFYHNETSRGRAFGTSDQSPVKNMQIVDWQEFGIPPEFADDTNTSYFHNVQNFSISDSKLLQGLVIGKQEGNQHVENFTIERTNIDAKDPLGLLQFNGPVKRGLIKDCHLKSESQGNPPLVTSGDSQEVEMDGGSITQNNRHIQTDLNQTGGDSKVVLKKVERKYLN